MDDPTRRCSAWSPCLIPHHHHHHHHHRRHCNHHHHMFICPNKHQHQHQHHQHHCLFNCPGHQQPKFAPFPQNPQPPVAPCTFPNVLASGFEEAHHLSHQMLEEQENDGLQEEEDDDPVFVLTDEWREFFAKSEAERKQRTKQANKGKKK